MPASSVRTSRAYWATNHPDDEIVVLDALTYAGDRRSLAQLESSGRVSFVHGDICDQALVESTLVANRTETIVHFAAESHNSLAILDPARFFRTNVLGTQSMCDAARRVGVPRFHHISTCEVYGDLALDSDESFREDSPYRPRTPYNASKAGADHVVRSYIETFELKATITNCCNNYGPYQFPEKVIPLFSTRALEGESPPALRLYEEQAGVAARRRPLPCDRARPHRGVIGETYNVGSGEEASIEDIADGVLAATGQPDSLKTIVPDRPATTAATCSTRPRSAPSSAGSRPSSSRPAWRRRSPGTARTGSGGSL